ncbi:hypothetical protein NDA15_000491 [Ustilago hordei]|nr:hypothetical protein NDA15_000491 [Ustilago hordei]
MESIASKGLKDLVKIFQPLDQELQEIHRKKPFELKDDLWSAKEPLATPDRPWGSISLDFIEGLPPSKKYDSKTYDSILVIVDRLTKFAILAPTHKTVTAKQTAYLQEQIREAQRRSVNQYNRKHKDIEFKVGDMVYINRRNWKTRRPTPKLDTRFAGPYPVQEQPTIPSLPDEDLDFEVEALIDKRSHNGTTEYKVLWRGYSEEAASWEPVENLNCPDLIQEYEVSEGGRNRRNRERRRKENDVEKKEEG